MTDLIQPDVSYTVLPFRSVAGTKVQYEFPFNGTLEILLQSYLRTVPA